MAIRIGRRRFIAAVGGASLSWPRGARAQETSVPLLTDDSQIGANLRFCADEENRADWDQRG